MILLLSRNTLNPIITKITYWNPIMMTKRNQHAHYSSRYKDHPKWWKMWNWLLIIRNNGNKTTNSIENSPTICSMKCAHISSRRIKTLMFWKRNNFGFVSWLVRTNRLISRSKNSPNSCSSQTPRFITTTKVSRRPKNRITVWRKRFVGCRLSSQQFKSSGRSWCEQQGFDVFWLCSVNYYTIYVEIKKGLFSNY